MMAKSFRPSKIMPLTTTQQRKEQGLPWRLSVFVLMIFMLSGCGKSGDKLRPVSGKVSFQGKPVATGAIRFSNPQAGIDMTAQLHPDGTYEVLMARGRGLPEGTYQVAIVPPGAKIPLGPMKERPKPQECLDIPSKYRSTSSSGLTLTVKPSDNRLDIDMQP